MELIVKQINETYLIDLPGYWYKDIVIDGVRHNNVKGEYILENKPEKIQYVTKHTVTVSYGALTPSEYDFRCNAILKGDDEDSLDIEREYQLKRLRADNPPVTEEVERLNDFDLIFYNITGDISNPYITPFRYLGKNPIDKNKILYRYTPNLYKLAATVAERFDFTGLDAKPFRQEPDSTGRFWTCPDHCRDNLRFMKINGKYKFYDQRIQTYVFDGSYEECLARYKKDLKSIEDAFAIESIILDSAGKNFDKKMLLEALLEIQSKVNQIIPAAKSKVLPSNVGRDITQLLDKIKA